MSVDDAGAAADAPAPSQPRHVLVIGGTQFMGRHLVEGLLREGTEVTVLNRGRTPNPFPPSPLLHFLACDRLADRPRFRTLLLTSKWDAVVDFVAFRPRHVRDVWRTLKTTVAHYVFISSDSVYMACRAPPHTDPVRETDALWPEGAAARCALRRRDRHQYGYGGNKLRCEAALESAWRRDGFPFTALRVADVVGPYDNLGCHLRLQQRLRAGWRVGTRLANVPDADTHRISVAYAPDVAAAVLAVLRAGPAVHGEALNIACTEACTYPEYIGHVARALGCVPRIDPRVSADMVSVCIGPIDTTKARRLLQWDPTPLADAVEATVRWYLDPANVAYTLRFDADSSSGSDPG